MYELPTQIELSDGTILAIRDKGDFRMVLDCFEILNDQELDKQERVFGSLVIFYNLDEFDDIVKIPDIEEAYDKMVNFFNVNQPESIVKKPKLIDWNYDSTLIFSAVNNVAGKEVRLEEYLHWWTFMGYYMSIGESALSTIVSIRDKIVKGKKLEKYEQEYKKNNPEYFNWDFQSTTDKDMDKLVREIWNSGGQL